jgi:hypothetical protein
VFSLNSLGEIQKALDFFTQALSPSCEVGNRSGQATTLGNIAYAKRALSQFDESSSKQESILKTIESLGAKVVCQELRASYFATEHSYYELYVDMLMEM